MISLEGTILLEIRRADGQEGVTVSPIGSWSKITLYRREALKFLNRVGANWMDKAKLNKGITVRKVVQETEWDSMCRGSHQ